MATTNSRIQIAALQFLNPLLSDSIIISIAYMLFKMLLRLTIERAAVNCRVKKNRKRKKTFLFLSPTQFPIQGQWWSNVATQWSHCLQCLQRSGYSMWQIVQYFDSTKNTISSSSVLFYGVLYVWLLVFYSNMSDIPISSSINI